MKNAALFLVALLLANVAHAVCSQSSLRVAIIPNINKSLETLRSEYQPLLNKLTLTLGMPVELVSPSTSYESVVDAIVSGGVDVAWLGPAAYVMAHQRDPRVEPFARLVLKPGHYTPAGHHYQSLLLTRRATFTEVTQLRGKQVALSDPASTSGSVVPNFEFSAKVSQPLTYFFSSVVYAGSHDKSLDALLTGRVEAAFVASVEVDAYLKNGRITRDTFDVLWRSEPLYYSPYVFSAKLCPKLRALVRTAMLNDQSDLVHFLDTQDATGISPATHDEYASLQRMREH
jgi:phosphonate transport system substrate-binding protein